MTNETVQYTPLMYEEMIKRSPYLRTIIEGKIAEEVAKKQKEIDALKLENSQVKTRVTESEKALNEIILSQMGGGF